MAIDEVYLYLQKLNMADTDSNKLKANCFTNI
jgi:hypothetical protein